jgi:tetratricopeptide (TPR) repeat protein
MTDDRPPTSAPPLVEAALADPAGFLAGTHLPVAVARTDPADAPGSEVAADPHAAVEARWARGLARRELGQLEGARDELRAAAAAADAEGAHDVAGAIRSSLALVLFHLGATDAALDTTSAAARTLRGAAAARNRMQLGLILQRLGRQREAIAAYDVALPELVAAEDHAATARLVSNRGVLHAYLGDLTAARADLERSVALARELDSGRAVAFALQNLGFVAGREGQLTEALRLLGEADALLHDLEDGASARASLDADRAAILAEAGLLDEAIERAHAAVRAHGRTRDRTNVSEAELLLARLQLLAGDLDAAAAAAGRAGARFAEDGRAGWELQARYVVVAARAAAGEPVPVAEATELADELAGGGWPTEARVVRLWAARRALEEDDISTAKRSLAELVEPSRRAPALARAQHRHATALVRAAEGDRRGARRAIDAGLTELHRSWSLSGSAELRAHAARHTVELAELGIRLALESGRPASALQVLDRVRAADRSVPPTPPSDAQLAADLAELRRLAALELDTAQAGGDVSGVIAARARTERRVRDRARLVAQPESGPARERLDTAALRAALDGRSLAAYLQLDGHLHVLTVAPAATTHRVLGPLDEVRSAVGFLRSALRRLAVGRGSPAAIAAADASLARSVAALAALLGLDLLDPEGLVVVPCAALDGTPWGALGAATGHLPTITPSPSAWLGPSGHPIGGRQLLVAGPRLPGARAEVLDLAAPRPDATVLVDAAATAAGVLAAMATAGTAHIACHGTFRGDNPLLSSLELADGPLTVYELERIQRVPARIVLSSCDAATGSTLAGDAVLGLSSALLRLGASSLIAPALAIPDDATRPLMLALHAQLDRGLRPAAALAAAVAEAEDALPADRAVRASFVVHGSAAD